MKNLKIPIAKLNTFFVSLLSMGRRGGLSLGWGDLVLLHSRPGTVGMPSPDYPPPSSLSMRASNILPAIASVLLLVTSEVGATNREGRVLSNPFGFLGHAPCTASDESGNEQTVGR